MHCTVPEIDYKVLKHITDRILSEVDGVCRVLYEHAIPRAIEKYSKLADVHRIKIHALRHSHAITDRILSEVDGVCRVLYDLSPKPIATIEWE